MLVKYQHIDLNADVMQVPANFCSFLFFLFRFFSDTELASHLRPVEFNAIVRELLSNVLQSTVSNETGVQDLSLAAGFCMPMPSF